MKEHQVKKEYGNDQVTQKMKSLSDAFERGDNIALLDRISLNTVRILVDGIMTIDVNNVPTTITSVEMDGGNDSASVWTEGEKTGVIKGSYLVGGVATIAGPEPTSVTDVAVTAGSTASELHFKMKLARALKSGQKLTFKVVKKDSKNKDLESVPFDFVIPEFKAQR